MKAVIYTHYGAPEVLQLTQLEKPTPKDNQVLVKVFATSVATGDVNARNFVFVPKGLKFMARLMFGLNKPKKQVLGLEFAGEIVAVGKDVTTFKVGDRVFGLDGTNVGSYAEYKTIAHDAGITLMPANLSYEEAVSIPNGALTALTYIKNKANLRAGQSILINGASGSVGIAAVQIAKSLDAHVTAVCSGNNAQLVKSFGADVVIDYQTTDFTQQNQTYDFILDTVGNLSFAQCKRVLNPNGAYLAVAGGIREMRQSATNKRVKAGPSSERQADLLIIKDLVEAGKLKPVIDRCYPLEQIVEAHRYADSGRKKGNIVITIGAQ